MADSWEVQVAASDNGMLLTADYYSEELGRKVYRWFRDHGLPVRLTGPETARVILEQYDGDSRGEADLSENPA